MSALTAEQLDSEFLKHFMPETLYLIEEDLVPVVSVTKAVQPEAVSDNLRPVSADLPESEDEETAPTPVPPSQPVAVIPKLPKVESIPMPKAFDVIGENRKGLIVLVTLSDADFRVLPQSQFLVKILAAIGFGPADVAFVNNISGAITRFEMLRETMQTNYIISFASRLDTDLPHEKFTLYNPVSVDNVPIVFSQSLAKLDGNQDEKKQLWEALKVMFSK